MGSGLIEAVFKGKKKESNNGDGDASRGRICMGVCYDKWGI